MESVGTTIMYRLNQNAITRTNETVAVRLMFTWPGLKAWTRSTRNGMKRPNVAMVQNSGANEPNSQDSETKNSPAGPANRAVMSSPSSHSVIYTR